MPKNYSNIPEKKWKKIGPALLPPRNTRVQEILMTEIHGILLDLNIHHWLSGGELVNIYRDGKLQPHNQDIDYACYAEEIQANCAEIEHRLMESLYDIRTTKNNTRINAYKNGEMVAIQGFILKGKYRWLKNRRVPAKYFNPNSVIEFNGLNYPCLSPIEKYLSWRYSNWKKEYKGDTKLRDKYINKKKLMGK